MHRAWAAAPLFGALLIAAASAAATSRLPQPAPTARIEIDAGTVAGRISPLLYGQFAEFMFEGIKGGLSAELIRNRGFEDRPSAIGLSHHWERYPDDRNDDYAISFGWDETVAYGSGVHPAEATGGHSLRIQLRPGVVARHGVFQPRVPVREGLDYPGYLWIKSDAFTGGVSVSLEADVNGGRIYDEAPIADVGGDWKRYAFALRPAASDPNARFAILVSGVGKLWVDQVSLLPGDAVDGVRAEVLDKVKALAPSFIRWPGGNVAQDYRWQWGIGPRDERPSWVNPSWNNEVEPADFGTDEFVRFARLAGAEPSITVNVEGRGATVDEAAAWVEYCNGPATSRYGMMRARNGHSEPYRVKYWEIGNEIWGDWVRGHSDAVTYARNLTSYVARMRAVDSSIQVIAVGDNDMTWNRTVLTGTGERVDYLAVHHYYGRREMGGDLRNLLARPLHYERFYRDVEAAWRELPLDRRPKLAINEWGLDIPESQQYSIVAALYGARLMNVFERQSDLVAMSAVSDLVNGWPGGIIQAGRHGVFVTPIYLVNRLYATHLGAERLATRVDGPTLATTREGNEIPVLDFTASRSADGRRIFVKAVNTDLHWPLSARVELRGAQVSPDAIVKRVVADSLSAVNGFATPEAVRVTQNPLRAGNSFSLELPRHSVSVVTLTVRR
ncbi:MAG TPA: alpha-L-arabinofuranosidase C-terminal domain-containing protein [Vicinamibacterales bacterium]|nr:alpha-L-arabinofuranosidase C-terminal domain-containing protein [Vicinamibacterales bacterium]